MQIWLEIISSFPERAGEYLICPIHAATKRNYPLYQILEEPYSGDMVFHYLLKKASKKTSAIASYSFVEKSYYIKQGKDSLCDSPPPYRKVKLINNMKLNIPITYEMLLSKREKLEEIIKNYKKPRTPFDKNFRIKQLYLSRIPKGFLKIFTNICGQNFVI